MRHLQNSLMENLSDILILAGELLSLISIARSLFRDLSGLAMFISFNL